MTATGMQRKKQAVKRLKSEEWHGKKDFTAPVHWLRRDEK